MELEKKCLRWSLWMVAAALLLRLISNDTVHAFLQRPEVVSLLVAAQTGRYVNPKTVETIPPTAPPPPAEEKQPEEDESPEASEEEKQPEEDEIPEASEEEEEEDGPVYTAFGMADAALVAVKCHNGYDIDVLSLLQKPLLWDLTGEEPTVLIVHSHGSEGYQNTASNSYRTLDVGDNMISVGDRLVEELAKRGIRAVQDTTMHDQPSYNKAYTQSRKAVKSYLEQYPSVRLVLDLHRDAIADSKGNQLGYTVKQNGEKVARMMLVVGTDASGKTHPNWQENMAMAVKLHAQLEKTVSGICRPISFRRQRFNQDLSTGAVIVEVGAAGNHREEAIKAMEILADSIAALAHGTLGELS